MSYKASVSKKSKLGWKIPLIIILLAGCALAALELTNTTHLLHKKQTPATIPATTKTSEKKDEAPKKSTSTKSDTKESAPIDKSQATPPSTSTKSPDKPSGDFISNNTPGKDGTPTKEQSVCVTTPGATCYIQFTNTTTKEVTKLPTQKIDSSGFTVWNWDASTLTKGTWSVTATATIGSNSKTSTYPLTLEVGQ